MDVLFSTVVRSAPPEKGGELVWLNWSEKRIIDRVPIMATNPILDDPNPRGSTHGGRGLEVIDNYVYVTTYHTIKVFQLCNQRLEFVRDISHPLMVGLHETVLGETGKSIWVTSTAIDAVFEIDLESGDAVKAYWPRELPALARELDLTPMKIDKEVDNRDKHLVAAKFGDKSHLHLNAVALWQGEAYALFNKYGVIVNLSTEEIIIHDTALAGAHNLSIVDGKAYANGTLNRTVRIYDLSTKKAVDTIDLTQFSWVQQHAFRHETTYRLQRVWNKLSNRKTRMARPLFVRGLDVMDQTMLVGVSPAAILQVDIETGTLVDTFKYSSDVRDCIHGLQHLPAQEHLPTR